MKITRQILQDLYLDYINNFASSGAFAEYHGLTLAEGIKLIELGRMVHHTPHPEA